MKTLLRSMLAIVVALSATAAFAQPKPALVQDRDEPGRAPYQRTFQVVPADSHCTSAACTFPFDTVPAGKRLVITHVNVGFRPDTAGSDGVATISDSADPATEYFVALSPGPPGAILITATAEIRLVVETGHAPEVSIIPSSGFADAAIVATLAGYFVNLP